MKQKAESTTSSRSGQIVRWKESIASIRSLEVSLKKINDESTRLHGQIYHLILNFFETPVSFDTPIDQLIARYTNTITRSHGHGALKNTEFDQWVSRFNALKIEAKTACEEIAKLKKEMDAEVKLIGSALDRELLGKYEDFVGKATKALLPFSSDQSEADAVARGLDGATQIHLRIGGWMRETDVITRATILIGDLQAALPELN